MDERAQEKKDRLAKLRDAVRDAGGATVVARRIGTTRSHLHNVMTGRRQIGRTTAKRLRRLVPDELLLDLVCGTEKQ